MKTTLKTLLCAVAASFFAAPLWAEDPAVDAEPPILVLEEEGEVEAEEEVRLIPPIRLIDEAVEEVELTDEQEQKYDELLQQHVPQIQKHFQQQQSIYTPEQKKKRREVVKKGKEDGLKGQKLQQFVQSQVPLTPQQQKQYTDHETEIKKCQTKFRQEFVQILTPQQQEQLPPFTGKKGKGKGKPGKRRPPTPEQGKPQPK